MESLLDRASPRRGSLTSLHRYSSGSFSHNTKQSSPSNTLQVNNTNLYALCKDLDKFTRYFIVKAVQVIVQSRLNGSQKVNTDCKPAGNDWFNLNISDIVDVSDKTKAVLDSEGLSVKANWRVCCEISLRTNDDSRVVLEHWIISNKTSFNSNLRLNSDLVSPKSYKQNSKAAANHLTSSNTSNGNGTSPLSAINSSGRVRPATFSSTSRTRLNSIDDADNTSLASNRYLLATNNENADIKPSTSCFSLSNAQASNQHAYGSNLIIESPSTNSLGTNATAVSSSSTNMQDQQLANSNSANNNSSSLQSQISTNKSSATSSSIYTIYNRMSLLLKTLLTTAHIVPAYRLASRSSQTDSCVICYRVYTVPRQTSTSRGSIEDINLNHLESPSRRSQTSISSLGSVDIRDFVGSDELDHFCPILKLGSIKTDINELDVSLCYRTDTRSAVYPLKSSRSREVYNRHLDEDCLIAAKQLLAGNVGLKDGKQRKDHIKNDSSNGDKLAFLDQPLKPAFANSDNGESTDRMKLDRPTSKEIGDCTLIESAFERLLQSKPISSTKEDDIVNFANEAVKSPTKSSQGVANGKVYKGVKSEPIQVPRKSNQLNNLISTPSSTPKSLSDSYVFVDLNPPFASDEQNDLNSFFHGPTPTFTSSLGSSKDVEDLTCQLATIEANASQIDEFVDNICVSEDDEEGEKN